MVSSRPHQGRWIVVFAGVDGRDGAEALRGTRLSAPALEEEGALWVHELIGAEVVDVDGGSHGSVLAVEANPASDLLVLAGGHLVPLTFVVERRADGMWQLPSGQGDIPLMFSLQATKPEGEGGHRGSLL